MSEQTDPLAQLIEKLANDDETTWQEAADAIRAAVLADPTIVGMERLTAKDMYLATLSPIYRTPEVKG